MSSPFDFQVMLEAANKAGPLPAVSKFLKASDGKSLAVRIYRPPAGASKEGSAKEASLIFYHGGGAHSGAGYQMLARGLAESFNVTVYTPDLRGHGESGGARGDAPSPQQVWEDIDTVLAYVEQDSDSKVPIFLGGHSSGGGLIVNYITEHQNWDKSPSLKERLKGYLLVAPQLGYQANIDRPLEEHQVAFAKVNVLAFIGNGITGLWGHNHAVKFSYPKDILEGDPGLVNSNTINMANAITPVAPQTQFQNINRPLKLWIGENDELFLADKVAAFAKEDEGKPNLSSSILPNETHLGILVDVHSHLGPWIQSQL